jgi:DNA integrity scanning protein DisA with diadenylate cyclase activity
MIKKILFFFINLIFEFATIVVLTAALISSISIALVLVLKRNITQSQSTSKKLQIEASSKKRNGGEEITKND